MSCFANMHMSRVDFVIRQCPLSEVKNRFNLFSRDVVFYAFRIGSLASFLNVLFICVSAKNLNAQSLLWLFRLRILGGQ